jgi:hypothetical protein
MKASDVEKARNAAPDAIVVDAKVMDRNARDAGNSVDWRATNLGTPKGGRLGCDPVRLVTDQIKRDQRQIAFDVAAELRADRLHQLLDELINEGEAPESDSDEPEEESAAEFSMDSLLQELAAIADEEPRSVGKDAVQKKICCVDCASLDGVKGFRKAQRAYEASRAHLI